MARTDGAAVTAVQLPPETEAAMADSSDRGDEPRPSGPDEQVAGPDASAADGVDEGEGPATEPDRYPGGEEATASTGDKDDDVEGTDADAADADGADGGVDADGTAGDADGEEDVDEATGGEDGPSTSTVGPERGFGDLVGDGPLATHFDGGRPVDVDRLLELLANPGRRYVLTYLLLAGEAVSTSELVEYIAVETGLEDPSDRLREEIAAELVEEQLPTLARAGYVEYNRVRQYSRATARSQLAVPYLYLASQQVARAGEVDG